MSDVEDSQNHGNLLALLSFTIIAGDSVLENHLCTAAQNATYAHILSKIKLYP